MRSAMLSNCMKTQVDTGGGRSPSLSKVVTNNAQVTRCQREGCLVPSAPRHDGICLMKYSADADLIPVA